MNVYESRSTVPDDVRKWSNECVAVIELWTGKLLILMSEMLHSIVKRSDALAAVWLPGLHLMPMSSDALAIECDARTAAPDRETIRCTDKIVHDQGCIQCWDYWMHADDCLDVRDVASDPIAIRWKTVDARIAASDRDEVRCTGDCLIVRTASDADAIRCTDDCLIARLLHPTVKRSDARWQLSVAKARCSQLTATSFAMKCRRFCIRCWNRRMHWRFCLLSGVLLAKLSVDADEASDVCWCCRLASWLQSKLLIDRSKCRLVAVDGRFSLIWLLETW